MPFQFAKTKIVVINKKTKGIPMMLLAIKLPNVRKHPTPPKKTNAINFLLLMILLLPLI